MVNHCICVRIHNGPALCASMQLVQVKRRDFGVKSGEFVRDASFKHNHYLPKNSLQSILLLSACHSSVNTMQTHFYENLVSTLFSKTLSDCGLCVESVEKS